MNEVIVDLKIDADAYLTWYRAPKAVVRATSRDGRAVQFPAGILRRFVTHDGIEGSFRILFDERGRFQRIERIA